MTQTMTVTKWFFNNNLVDNIASVEEKKNTVEFGIAKVEKETERAAYVWAIGYELDIVKIWIPKSQIKSEYKAETTVERTTDEKFFVNAVEAQSFVDEKKADGSFVSIKCINGGIKVFFKKA